MLKYVKCILPFFLVSIACWSYGQNTIGTIEIGDGVQEGYTGLSAYLSPTGDLVRTRRENNNTFFAGGTGGGIEIYNWFGAKTWEYILSDDTNVLHHDIAILPNGNILAIAFERITQEL